MPADKSTKKKIVCAYCSAEYLIKWEAEEFGEPEFCCFCSETFEEIAHPHEDTEDVEEDEEDYEDSSEDE